MIEIKTGSPAETIELARRFGRELMAGDIVLIFGELGAGKTTFVKGLAEGQDIPDFVLSPSFIIVNEHLGRVPFYHVDLYRLESDLEIQELALQEYFSKKGVFAVEWAERLKDPPDRYFSLKIFSVSEKERRFVFDEKGQERLEGLRKVLVERKDG